MIKLVSEMIEFDEYPRPNIETITKNLIGSINGITIPLCNSSLNPSQMFNQQFFQFNESFGPHWAVFN